MSLQLLKSGMIVSVMTFLSRILGLIRDIIVLNILGAGWATDVFLLAQKIPNFLRRLFAEGAFSQAFIPVLSEYQSNKTIEQVRNLISETAGTLLIILSVISIVGVIGSPVLISIFGPGFVSSPHQFELASLLLSIMFPYILFISLTAFCGSILNSVNRYAVPSFTPVLLNLSIIAAAIIVTPASPDKTTIALAWGVFTAGVLQLLLQVPFLWKEGLLVKPKWGWKSPGVQKILNLMGPALFGVSVGQINLLVDTVLASFLQDGSIAWLYVSDRMLEFPLGIFGIAISTVILPLLSRQHSTSNKEEFNKIINWGLRFVFLIGLPATIGLFIMAEPIILTVFQYGEFTEQDAFFASLSLRAYILGLVGFMLVKVLATGFYSRQDTKTPVKIGVLSMVINIVLNLILFFPLQHVGLALATSISAILNAVLLFTFLQRNRVLIIDGKWKSWFIKLTGASLLLIGFIYTFMEPVESWRAWSIFDRIWSMAILVFGSLVAYSFGLLIMRTKKSDFSYDKL